MQKKNLTKFNTLSWPTQKLGMEGSYLNTIKATYEKLKANIILSGEKLKASPLRFLFSYAWWKADKMMTQDTFCNTYIHINNMLKLRIISTGALNKNKINIYSSVELLSHIICWSWDRS